MFASQETSERLATAAEELVKAACVEVETTSLAIGRDSLEELKNIAFNSASLKNDFDDKIDTVNQNLAALKNEVGEVKSEVARLRSDIGNLNKMQRLEWAYSNIGMIESFKYGETHRGQMHNNSVDLCRNILVSFRTGRGHYLPKDAAVNKVATDYYLAVSDETKILFRSKICEQLRALTGTMPRLAPQDDGRYIIYFS
uniref:Uncharacterized protein n=1 Tax=Odontella aurita TaxID=265563 RepID=A0A7S4JPE0_9STRA|mmetsp:Transcript_50818/g.152983  ORF Transcript_50818/g.152983 Transcript_50818/m.152983 type:complete len:199 (+) Transcript_50818:345-941(+)